MPLKPTAISSVSLVAVRAMPAILILLALTLMVLHRADSLPVERLRTAVIDAATPALIAVSAPLSSLIENIDSVTSLRDLRAENIRLKEENAKLQKWYESALRLQAENQSFRDLLNVKADPDLHFVTARVISDPGGAFVKSVLLPVGNRDGVRKGNAVMSGHGLAGRIIETGQKSSRVLLVTDLNSRIPVIIQNTRTKAILAGKNQDLLKLERLPPDSGMTVGTRVMTTGDGGQLPADVPIGTIVSVGSEGVWVKPLSDIDRLSYVQVVNMDTDQSLATGEVAPSPADAHPYKNLK
jgi:rod shape-determining protein MreC